MEGREWYIRCTRVSTFFSSKLIDSCTNLECTSVVQDYAKDMNLKLFGPKVEQLEMKTIVNIESKSWMVLRR